MFSIFSTTKKDEEKLQALLQTSSGVLAPSLLSVKQERKDVHKELWQANGIERKVIKIQSPHSTVKMQDDRLVEELSHCDCWMQEKLYREEDTLMQEIRHIKAENAHFLFNEHAFKASNVSLTRYHAKGHVLPLNERAMTLVMKGKAGKADFKLKDEGFCFSLDRLKATFYPKGGS